MENVRALRQEREEDVMSVLPRAEVDDTLAAAIEPMQQADDLPDLCAGLASAVAGALHADACLVSLFDPKTGCLKDVAASAAEPGRLTLVAQSYDLADYPVTERVMSSGEATELGVADEGLDPAERSILDNLGFARVLICSFEVEGDSIGTIEAYRVDDRPFRRDDPKQVAVLTAVAAGVYTKMQLAMQLEEHYTKTLEALASALEARDPYTQAHTSRIRDMAVALAVAMKVPADVRRAVRLGSILHDVGKIGISDTILHKPGPLDDHEWKIMRTHPEIGEKMLESIDYLGPAIPVIRHHHERWDGKGYPDGLAGEDIPIGARIVAVCDAFDAMTSDRPYKKAMPIQAALEEIKRGAGGQFDPRCADLLIEVVTNMGEDRLEDKFIRYAS
jgi:HD-GYP domain-containing protein (c-di-GMP phosphodiesterase class II)